MNLQCNFEAVWENFVIDCSEPVYDATKRFVAYIVNFYAKMQAFCEEIAHLGEGESPDSSHSYSSNMNCKVLRVLEPRWLYTLEECQLEGAEVRN